MRQRYLLIVLLVIFTSNLAIAQNEISGEVIDKKSQEPLSGANVVVPGTNIATVSGKDGEFILTSEEKITELKVSYVGYQDKTYKIQEPDQPITIELIPAHENIKEVVVESRKNRDAFPNTDKIYTNSTITSKGLDMVGNVTKNSVFESISLLPGVQVGSQDASGLSNKTVKIRGINSVFSGMTVEGIPNYGIMPIGPRDYVYDMENIQNVSVYKGAVPADVVSATGNKGGVMGLSLKRPTEDFGVTAKRSVGSNSFKRSYVRINSGTLPSGTQLFGSHSYTLSDKWKGTGSIGPRNNIMLGGKHNVSDKTTIELYGIYNSMKRHRFRELNYEQASDIDEHYDFHFHPELNGNASDDVYYYDNNKGYFTNITGFGILTHTFSAKSTFSVKPYYAYEDGNYRHKQITGPPDNRNYMKFNRQRIDERYGLITELKSSFAGITFTAGYWGELNDLVANVHVYKLVNGGITKDLGVNPKTKNTSLGAIHSPYLQMNDTIGRFSWNAGIKYFYHADADTKNWRNSGDELERLPSFDYQNVSHSAVLPTVSVGYQVSENINMYAAYGKNYMRSYMYGPVKSIYRRNLNAFQEEGIDLQDILESWEMETSDYFDAGFHFDYDNYFMKLTAFYAKHHNVLTPVNDPEVDVRYPQNTGKVTSKGIELQTYLYPLPSVMVYCNPTYTDMSYDEDIAVSADSVIHVQGNQSPSVPKFSVNGGIQYSYKNFEATANVNYVGKRYGDATNTEKINSHTLLNLNAQYSRKIQGKYTLGLDFEVKNVLKTKYVGRIKAMDFEASGEPSYYAGAPRSFIVTLSLKL